MAVTQRDVQARIRRRIRDRLDELKMTARELTRALGHNDAWISGVLSGRQGVHWKDFDAVAAQLRMSPSELVRHDDAEVRELTPTEMRMLRHFQSWPEPIRHRWLDIWDFYAVTAPDRSVAILLTLLRDTPPSLRGPTTRWLEHLLREGIPPEQLLGVAASGKDGVASSGTDTKDPTLADRTRHAVRAASGDRFRRRQKSRLTED